MPPDCRHVLERQVHPQILYFNMKSKQTDLNLAIVYVNLNKKKCKNQRFIITKLRLFCIFSQSHTLPFQASHVFHFLSRHFPHSFSSLTYRNSFLCKAAILHKQRSPAHRLHKLKQLFNSCGSGRLSSAPQLLEHPQENPIVFPDR